LYFNNEFISRIADEFVKKYDISILDWFKCSFAAFTLFQRDVSVNPEIRISKDINIPEKELLKYLRINSYSVEELRQHYLQVRKETEKEFHFLISYAFLEKPILLLPNGKYVSPLPSLIIRQLGHGLNELIRRIDKNGYHLGKAFQLYCSDVLNCLSADKQLYDEDYLQKLIKGEKCCDFLLCTNHENILIECKAVNFNVKVLTENGLKSSGLVTKVVEGISQIYETIEHIVSGKLKNINLDLNKPFVPIIVTLEEIPEANSDWYYNKIILGNDKAKKLKVMDKPNLIILRPIILSVNTLEKLISFMSSASVSCFDLYNEWSRLGYHFAGDWGIYLSQKIATEFAGRNIMLQFMGKEFNSFLQTLKVKSDLEESDFLLKMD